MFKRHRIFCTLLVTTTAVACAHSVSPRQQLQANTPAPSVSQSHESLGVILETIPEPIDLKSKYLFYLHGAILEGTKGQAISPRFGSYEYKEILAAFTREGFTVISEVRKRGTPLEESGAKVAAQVDKLLKAGVAPERITILGASRGGGIALIASTLIRNRDVNFVILSSCADSPFFRKLHPNLYGNVLSIYDRDDDTGVRSCNRFIEQSSGVNRHQEIVLTTGLGHGIVYHPLKDWLDPLFNWVAPR